MIAGARATARRGFRYDRDRRLAAILAADCDEIFETGLLLALLGQFAHCLVSSGHKGKANVLNYPVGDCI